MFGGSGKPNWRDSIVALLLVAAIPACLFQIKLHFPQMALGDYGSIAVTLSGVPLVTGALLGIVLSGVCFYVKKPAVLICAVLALSVSWLLVPGNQLTGSVLLGALSICCISLCPFTARLLVSISLKGTKQKMK